jgi:uncharacterized protein YndB with AHSA1/START domain
MFVSSNSNNIKTINMATAEKTKITIQTTVNAPVEKVFKMWTNPDEIIRWSSPSEEWHTPQAEHEFKPGGRFKYHMEARDKSAGFDFTGKFDLIKPDQQIDYTIDDGRKVTTSFSGSGEQTKIVQTFEAETENTIELQRTGWQGILDNFKKYAEANA